MNVSLLTDMYELTMLQAAIKDGTVNRKAAFEVFARSLPNGFRYGVFAGLGRLLPMIEEFRFEGEELKWLREANIIDRDTYLYLSDYRFKGTITAYREGDLYFPHSPVLTVEGTFGECVLLETLILSVLNADSAIATKAARMVSEANGRKIIEMGSRRTHERSAVDAARAAYIAGFAATSNLQAGMTYGVPVTGTAAHAWTLAHGQEVEAFVAQIEGLGVETAMLVDTYDTEQGIANACEAASKYGAEGPGAIRIDSGDFFSGTQKARALLDELGATETKILVSGDMDEYTMKDLREAPIDGFGVGTKLVSTPPSGFVYKLVEIEQATGGVAGLSGETYMRRVAKKSKGKVSVGGKKTAYRLYDAEGVVTREVYYTDHVYDSSVEHEPKARLLNIVVMEDGTHMPETLESTRLFHTVEKALLPEGEQRVWVGTFDPFLTAEHVS